MRKTRTSATATFSSFAALAQMGKTLDLIVLRGKGRDEARQDLTATKLEARDCALLIFGAGGLEPGIKRARQDDEHEICLYRANRRQAYGGELG